MRKIYHIGCSFSCRGMDPVPRIVAEQMPDFYVGNFSHYCSSANNQLFAVNQIIGHRPDLIVLQWTTNSRMTFVTDADKLDEIYREHKLGNKWMKGVVPNYTEIDRNHYDWKNMVGHNGAVFHLSAGTSQNIKKRKHRYKVTYETSVLETLTNIGPRGTIFQDAIKHHAVTLLTKSKIPFIIYEHLDSEDKNNHYDFSVKRELGEKLFNKFCVDNGFHFERPGNTYVAEKLLIPLIKQKLNL